MVPQPDYPCDLDTSIGDLLMLPHHFNVNSTRSAYRRGPTPVECHTLVPEIKNQGQQPSITIVDFSTQLISGVPKSVLIFEILYSSVGPLA